VTTLVATQRLPLMGKLNEPLTYICQSNTYKQTITPNTIRIHQVYS